MLPRYPLPPIHDREWRQLTIFQYEEMRVADAVLQTIHADTATTDAGKTPCGILKPAPATPPAWVSQPQSTT